MAAGASGRTYGAGLDNLLQGQVHPGVALYQVAVECLSVLQLDEHGVALRRVQKAEGQLVIHTLT